MGGARLTNKHPKFSKPEFLKINTKFATIVTSYCGPLQILSGFGIMDSFLSASCCLSALNCGPSPACRNCLQWSCLKNLFTRSSWTFGQSLLLASKRRCNLLPMDVADRLTLLLANSIKTWKFNSWQRPWDLHRHGCLCSSQESGLNLFEHDVIDWTCNCVS